MQILNQRPININTNFRAMKPNQFQGIDYAVVRKFKAPVEKFNSQSDFFNWAKDLLQRKTSESYEGRQFTVTVMRKMIINGWQDYLKNNEQNFTIPEQLLVLSSLIKTLNSNDDRLPPTLRPNTLKQSITVIKNLLNKDKNVLFDFQNVYQQELKRELFKPQDLKDGWIIIPSRKNDPEHFEDNVEKLKILSAEKWCTKNHYAKNYLDRGDFHIYIKDGFAKVAIRFSGVEIHEIQGESNCSIPQEYITLIKDHIQQGNYYMNEDIEFMLFQFE